MEVLSLILSCKQAALRPESQVQPQFRIGLGL